MDTTVVGYCIISAGGGYLLCALLAHRNKKTVTSKVEIPEADQAVLCPNVTDWIQGGLIVLAGIATLLA